MPPTHLGPLMTATLSQLLRAHWGSEQRERQRSQKVTLKIAQCLGGSTLWLAGGFAPPGKPAPGRVPLLPLLSIFPFSFRVSGETLWINQQMTVLHGMTMASVINLPEMWFGSCARMDPAANMAQSK